jgi:hypothetical protein
MAFCMQRITIAEFINNEWFKKGYQPPRFETADVNLDDVNSIFNESGVSFCTITSHISPQTAVHGAVQKFASIAGPCSSCCREARRKTISDECF